MKPGLKPARKLFCHIVDVVLNALLLLKQPMAWLLAIFLSSYVVSYMAASAMDEICGWSVLSRLPICSVDDASKVPATDTSSPTNSADFPSLVAVQHRAVDHFTTFADTGYGLAVDLKQAELAVQDLILLVKASNLTLKYELSSALEEFVIDAKTIGRGLQGFSAKVYGTIDR